MRSLELVGASRSPHILSVAFPLLPVTSGSGGGAEQVLRLVEAGLVKAGFRSTVVAAEGSEICGALRPTPAADDTISDTLRDEAQHAHRLQIEAVLREEEIDLIHYHGLDFLDYRVNGHAPPQLATLHLPLTWYPKNLFEERGIDFNFVSSSQAESCPAPARYPVIPNGVELSQYRVAASKSDYLLWLGRICPEKGTAIALNVAHALNARLIIAGPVHGFEAHETYFEEQIRPGLDLLREYVGPIATEEKARLLSEARCLLVPSLAPETSSLVAMEAISSGTAVVAFRSGALPEVVEDGVTGFVVDSEDEMAEAVGSVRALNAMRIRERAEARFSSKTMTEAYLNVYRRMIDYRATNV